MERLTVKGNDDGNVNKIEQLSRKGMDIPVFEMARLFMTSTTNDAPMTRAENSSTRVL